MEINKIYNEDCLEGMKGIADGSVDMILCDLPYGTTQCKWDTVIPFEPLWEQYKRVIKSNGAIVLTAQSPFDKVLACSNLQMYRYEWIIEKTHATGHLNANRMPMKSHENALVFYKVLPTYNPQMTTGHTPVHSAVKTIESQNKTSIYGKATREMVSGGSTSRYPRDVIKFKWDTQKSSLHPTQKPVALFEYLIKAYTNPGELVLDNCMGSGTTAIACMNTGRNFIGFEMDKGYYDIAYRRIEDHKDKVKDGDEK